jgi:DNA-binding transcriptional ArsR family regulator
MSDETDDEDIAVVADLLQAIANPNRMRLVRGLHHGQSRRELVEDLPITESAASNHLRTLEDANLVYRGDNQWHLSPLGRFYADWLNHHTDTIVDAVHRIDAVEATARDELADVPLSDQERERAITRRKWELASDDLTQLLEYSNNRKNDE